MAERRLDAAVGRLQRSRLPHHLWAAAAGQPRSVGFADSQHRHIWARYRDLARRRVALGCGRRRAIAKAGAVSRMPRRRWTIANRERALARRSAAAIHGDTAVSIPRKNEYR